MRNRASALLSVLACAQATSCIKSQTSAQSVDNPLNDMNTRQIAEDFNGQDPNCTVDQNNQSSPCPQVPLTLTSPDPDYACVVWGDCSNSGITVQDTVPPDFPVDRNRTASILEYIFYLPPDSTNAVSANPTGMGNTGSTDNTRETGNGSSGQFTLTDKSAPLNQNKAGTASSQTVAAKTGANFTPEGWVSVIKAQASPLGSKSVCPARTGVMGRGVTAYVRFVKFNAKTTAKAGPVYGITGGAAAVLTGTDNKAYSIPDCEPVILYCDDVVAGQPEGSEFKDTNKIHVLHATSEGTMAAKNLTMTIPIACTAHMKKSNALAIMNKWAAIKNNPVQ